MRRRVTLSIVPLLFAAGLIFYKTRTSLALLRTVWSTGVIAARPEVVSLGSAGAAFDALHRSINYFLVIWPALAFGILISAAVRAYVPPDLWKRMLAVRGTASQLRAGLAGTPLMLCSCCVAPIFGAVYESSARLAPALTLMLASPALNPAALALTFMLFGPGIGAMRLILSVAGVAAIGPSVELLFPRLEVATSMELNNGSRQESLARALYAVVVRTVPALAAGLLVSMFVVQSLPAGAFAAGTPRIIAILFVATLAVPLALPTFLEIPLALSLLSAGLPSGAAIALLFAGPAINLPSLLATARIAGWKVAVSVAVFVWMIALAGGLLM
ncbi:MAG: hypothetical protein DMG16_00200 [Acidobacteria bacterium]|nr:MAG: hypothetical protein DMG16_00200 [Acidobacteriota bacterium]